MKGHLYTNEQPLKCGAKVFENNLNVHENPLEK